MSDRLREPAHTDIGGRFAGRDELLGAQPGLGLGKGTRANSSAILNPAKAGMARAAKQKAIDRQNDAVQMMRAQQKMDKMF